MPKTISSTQNPAIKSLLKLKDKARERKKTGLFVVEGIRETQMALQNGYEVEKIYIQSEIFKSNQIDLSDDQTISLSPEVYNKVAYRGSTEGIIAVLRSKTHALNDLKLTDNPLILIAEAPEKPGNIGALLRTADAAGIDAVFIANPKSDLYNPNIIRSSVGCVFTQNIVIESSTEIIKYLYKKNIKIFTAALEDDAQNYLAEDYTGPSAIVVGTESTGLSDEWLNAGQSIIIPMRGKIDSMNVSVASSVIIFEAVRQRSK